MAKKRVSVKPSTNDDIKTTSGLRRMLLDTIRGVRTGDIDHKQGSTVATLAKTVIASAKLDFDVVRFHRTLEGGEMPTELKAIELSK